MSQAGEMHEPNDLIEALTASTGALSRSVDELMPTQIAEPSALPSWSRGHVLTHLARNADGLRVLLLAARTGESLSMYASQEARDADIEAGGSRAPQVILADFTHTARSLAHEIAHLPPETWAAPVTFHTTAGLKTAPCIDVLDMRLREVEIHHADLDVGHDFAGTATATLHHLLTYAVDRLSDQGPRRIELTASDLDQTYVIRPNDSTSQVSTATAPASHLLRYATGRGHTTLDLPAAPEWG